MTTFVLVHGSGDGGWAWHLVQRALRDRGHEAVAPDLPTDREDATWDDCVDVLVAAAGGAQDVVVVGHSSGGFVVPLAADRLHASLQVHVAGMVPRPGESAAKWFEHVGWHQAVADLRRGFDAAAEAEDVWYHDVPAPLARQAVARARPTGDRLGGTPWPSCALPDIPARYVVTTQDRFLPPTVQRRVAAERLGIAAPDELDAGHCATLSRPRELAALLVGEVDRTACG